MSRAARQLLKRQQIRSDAFDRWETKQRQAAAGQEQVDDERETKL